VIKRRSQQPSLHRSATTDLFAHDPVLSLEDSMTSSCRRLTRPANVKSRNRKEVALRFERVAAHTIPRAERSRCCSENKNGPLFSGPLRNGNARFPVLARRLSDNYVSPQQERW
jgi:hypothetical protein